MQIKNVSGYHLKMIALVTMLIDHIGAVVSWRVLQASYNITASMQMSNHLGNKIIVWFAEHQNFVYTLYEYMRMLGRMAFPLYCFLLVEGFLHTRNVKKYASFSQICTELAADLCVYSNLIFPVLVFISHLPVIVSPRFFGSSVVPVFVLVTNTVPVGSLPQTLPVFVLIKNSRELQSVNKTFPVLRLIVTLSFASNLSSVIVPVFPFELKFLQETSHIFTLPVFT